MSTNKVRVAAYGDMSDRAADLQNMEFPLQIKRQYAGPIDTTEIFTSLVSAQEYASTGATKYVGQIIQVVEGGKAKAYIIQEDGSLTEVGAATATDGKSIELRNGKLSLVGFDGAVEEGMQLWTVNGEDGQMTIEWRKPDSTTIEGLTQRVVTLEDQIKTKVENTKIAGSDLGLIRSQDDGSVGAVKVDQENGTAKVEKVQNAVNAETATNATQLNGHEDTYFAKQSDMTTVQGSVEGLQSDVAGLKDGSVKAKTAELADSATKLATAHNFSITGDGTAEAIPFDGTGDVALNLLLATVGKGGTGCKVTVDTKGRVTQVEALTAEDIPSLTHDKITDLGTAATKNVGTSAGQVVVVAADGKIDSALMPAIAITDIKTVDSQEAMLALKDVQIGDIAIRTDESKSYILTGDTPSDLSSWTWLRTPDCKVLSVNNKTGAVVLTTDDIAEGGTNKYFTATAFTTEFKKHASTDLTDTATLLRSTDTLILDGGAVTEE